MRTTTTASELGWSADATQHACREQRVLPPLACPETCVRAGAQAAFSGDACPLPVCGEPGSERGRDDPMLPHAAAPRSIFYIYLHVNNGCTESGKIQGGKCVRGFGIRIPITFTHHPFAARSWMTSGCTTARRTGEQDPPSTGLVLLVGGGESEPGVPAYRRRGRREPCMGTPPPSPFITSGECLDGKHAVKSMGFTAERAGKLCVYLYHPAQDLSLTGSYDDSRHIWGLGIPADCQTQVFRSARRALAHYPLA